jgi:Protein of unknown function (DUF2612)
MSSWINNSSAVVTWINFSSNTVSWSADSPPIPVPIPTPIANGDLVNWINNSSVIVSWINSNNNTVNWRSNNKAISVSVFDWTQTLLSQYVDSPTINELLSSYSSAVNPSNDIVNFYNNIWNIATAVGNGLDIWGQIVNVSRYLLVPITPNYFGFKEAIRTGYESTGPQPFCQASFALVTQSTDTYALTDSNYRRLIMIKAAANISGLSIPAINKLLQQFYGISYDGQPHGIAYVIDNENMSLTYHFNFTPSPVQIAIINNSGVFPRPAGVSVAVTY